MGYIVCAVLLGPPHLDKYSLDLVVVWNFSCLLLYFFFSVDVGADYSLTLGYSYGSSCTIGASVRFFCLVCGFFLFVAVSC